MNAAVSVGRKEPPAALAASSRFGPFAPEIEHKVREKKVQQDPKLEAMMAAWKSVEYSGQNSGECYGNCVTAVRNRDYSAKEVERFSLSIAEFQNEDGFGKKFGLFLSALVNTSQEDEFVIHTTNLDCIDFIGYRNEKEVIVKGNCDRGIGSEMKGGSIQVEGNAEEIGAGMEYGKITVKGNAGGKIGWFMKGGEITVDGNAGEVGRCMFNGSITVAGDVKQLGLYMGGGTISVGGNAGDKLCLNMHGGLITIRGDAGIGIGQGQHGGSITVNGNAGELLGIQMEGGVIRVNGNAGKDIGLEMSGGEIHIYGDHPCVSDEFKSGKVFHKGRLIVDK